MKWNTIKCRQRWYIMSIKMSFQWSINTKPFGTPQEVYSKLDHPLPTYILKEPKPISTILYKIATLKVLSNVSLMSSKTATVHRWSQGLFFSLMRFYKNGHGHHRHRIMSPFLKKHESFFESKLFWRNKWHVSLRLMLSKTFPKFESIRNSVCLESNNYSSN